MTILFPDLNLYRRLSQDAGIYKELHELLCSPRTELSSLHPPRDMRDKIKKNWNVYKLQYQDKHVLHIQEIAYKSGALSHDLLLFMIKLPGIPEDLSVLQPLTRSYKAVHSYAKSLDNLISQYSTKTLTANIEDIYMHLHAIYSDIHPET